jgi:hypothetical protein
MSDAQYVPAWNYPHGITLTRSASFTNTTIESVEDIDPIDVVEMTRSANNTASSSTSSSSSSTTVETPEKEPNKVDPFATWAWQKKDRIEKNNATMTEYLEGGGTHYRQTWLFNATWCGFGPIMRSKMWGVRMQFCTAQYVDLRRIVEHRGVPYTVYVDIMKDIDRTYSQLESQSARRQPEKIYQLLLALAAYNPSIGYTQGMNRIAMLLVDVFDVQWQQFWAFDYIINKIAVHYFCDNAVGQSVDAALAVFYIRRRDSVLVDALAAYDAQMGCFPNIIITNLVTTWFPSLFVSSMRFENVLRLWDSIVMDGATVLFEFLYRILQANRAFIVAEKKSEDSKQNGTESQRFVEGPDLIMHLNTWLRNLTSLDDVLSIKIDLPITLNDLEARRASQLNVFLCAREGDKNFNERLATRKIPNYENMGRGCLCAIVQNRSSLMSDTMPLAAPLRAFSASPRRTTESGTSVASSNNTIGSTNSVSKGHATRSAARDLGGRAQNKRMSLPTETDSNNT